MLDLNEYCNGGTPLVPPSHLVVDVCYRSNGATHQGTKTITTVSGTTTVVFTDSKGAVVPGAVEVPCPPLVLVANQCCDSAGAGVTGPAGAPGAAGTNGTDGATGTAGPAGSPGAAGTNGTNGANAPATAFTSPDGSVVIGGTPPNQTLTVNSVPVADAFGVVQFRALPA